MVNDLPHFSKNHSKEILYLQIVRSQPVECVVGRSVVLSDVRHSAQTQKQGLLSGLLGWGTTIPVDVYLKNRFKIPIMLHFYRISNLTY